jgi:hypothetical protein
MKTPVLYRGLFYAYHFFYNSYLYDHKLQQCHYLITTKNKKGKKTTRISKPATRVQSF